MSQVQSSTAPSPDQPPLHAMQAGNITYLTGGIGDDERDQLDAMKPSYNLRVLNASTSGEYVVNTHVVLRNQQGSELLDIPAGPILLVSLPKGTYTLDASHAGAERTEQIKIAGSKATSLHFVWK